MMKFRVVLFCLLSLGLSLGCKNDKKKTTPAPTKKPDPTSTGGAETGGEDPDDKKDPAVAGTEENKAAFGTKVINKTWRVCRIAGDKKSSKLAAIEFKETANLWSRVETPYKTDNCKGETSGKEEKRSGTYKLKDAISGTEWAVDITENTSSGDKTYYQTVGMKDDKLLFCKYNEKEQLGYAEDKRCKTLDEKEPHSSSGDPHPVQL